ncbi:MAG TPA: hypothetical protein VN669_18220 [Candidatus Acidoferrales bacterium]|nr:hypothetical protein [Candidatus Acidoferrales bacterium]
MKTLFAMMRIFHYVVGITAPDKEHEKQTLFLWIALAVALLALTVLFAWFIVPRVLN